MKFIFASLLCFIFTPLIQDISTLNNFSLLIEKYQPEVENALENEGYPGLILPESLRYICHSGCFEDIFSTEIKYTLMGTKALYLAGKYPQQDFVYYRI